jgi:uncharacterized protein
MTLVAILGLGIAGNVVEPHWSPTRYDAPRTFLGVPPADVAAAPIVADEVAYEEVSLAAHGQSLAGIVYSPDRPGTYPAVVFVHGAGTKDAHGFAEQAEYLARAGIVTLVAEKRSNGYSTWHRDYDLMAGDVLAGVEYLRTRPDVDAANVGLIGESEGSWITPLAVAQDPDIAFSVMVSAPIVPPSQQATYATLMAFDNLDVPEPVNRAVAKGIGLATSVPNLLEYADFDVLPVITQNDVPMLMVFGTEDNAVPLIQAADLVYGATAQQPNAEVTVRYFSNAQHGIRIGSDVGPFASGYLDLLADWITSVAADGRYDGVPIAGGQPTQTLSATAVPPAPWYATAYAHIVVLAIAVLGYLAGPIAALLLRLRRGPAAAAMLPARRRRLRWLRVLGLGSLLSLVGYFVGLSHLALNHLTNPILTYGMWAVVWIVTASAVTALLNLWLGNTWRTGGLQLEAGADLSVAKPNKVELIAMTGAVTGTVLLLLIVTYWGVFLGI